MRVVLALLTCACACSIRERSPDLACATSFDCAPGRECFAGYCVVAGDPSLDAEPPPPRADARPPDAALADALPPPPDAEPSDAAPCPYGLDPSCPGASCLDILALRPGSPDGTYWIDPESSGAFRVVCDMIGDGGGWTLVVNIRGDSAIHGDTIGAVGDVSLPTTASKLADSTINALNTGGRFRYRCADGAYDAFVTNDANQWTSERTNAFSWSIDRDRDGFYECLGANRAGYVFSDHNPCYFGHTNYAAMNPATEGTGCYVHPGVWGSDGTLWAR